MESCGVCVDDLLLVFFVNFVVLRAFLVSSVSDRVIQLNGVSVRFGSQAVLRGIALGIGRQQTLCIIGESGCGKTVTLKLIVGLLRPTAGDVLFENASMNSLSEK